MLWWRTKSHNIEVSSYVKLNVVVVRNSANWIPSTNYCLEKGVCPSRPPPFFFFLLSVPLPVAS